MPRKLFGAGSAVQVVLWLAHLLGHHAPVTVGPQPVTVPRTAAQTPDRGAA